MGKKATNEKNDKILILTTSEGVQLVPFKSVVYVKAQGTKGRNRHCECVFYPKKSSSPRVLKVYREKISDLKNRLSTTLIDVNRGQSVNLKHVEGYRKNGDVLFLDSELNGNCKVNRKLLQKFKELLLASRND